MEIEIFHYLFLSSIIFILGICGISINRKNLIIILMSIELILLSININFVAFSVYLKDLVGQIYSIFILTIAASEAAIGLAIIVTFYRNKSSIEIKDINNLGG